ncbi:MAG: DNA-protecting protein DprA [Proteobacteria bacterium]|nr:DNA-protecting protein DprA [Pseudomonadota bacterium]
MKKIDIESCEYPELLKQIKDPPPVLYFKGEWNPDLFINALSVVGSRRMTSYGEIMTEEFISAVCRAGITVVSGFMYGIDAHTHQTAVDNGGYTIAVMPCGIERVHPEYQSELHSSIINSGGLIVSEYPGDSPPALWTYPRRNRIITGLSPTLLVIEAGLKSGALITAGIAKRYGKKIFAVPGPLTSSVSLGTSSLIKEGASIVTGTEDLLSEYGIKNSDNITTPSNIKLNKIQKSIMDLLHREPLAVDEITRHLNKSISETGAELTILCINRSIIFRDGRYYPSGEKIKGRKTF